MPVRACFAELTEAMREKLDQLPDVATIFEQPIANRLGEMLSGPEGKLSVNLFGPDLEVLGEKIQEIRNLLAGR